MFNKLFSLEEEIFKVIANEKRLEIIQLLRLGELNVSEMIAMLGLKQANLSQHLTLLRQVGVVETSKKGREIYYRLSSDHVGAAVDSIHRFIRDKFKIELDDLESPFPFVVDPVCNMRFSASDAYGSVTRDGRQVYFCASGCLEKYSSL